MFAGTFTSVWLFLTLLPRSTKTLEQKYNNDIVQDIDNRGDEGREYQVTERTTSNNYILDDWRRILGPVYIGSSTRTRYNGYRDHNDEEAEELPSIVSINETSKNKTFVPSPLPSSTITLGPTPSSSSSINTTLYMPSTQESFHNTPSAAPSGLVPADTSGPTTHYDITERAANTFNGIIAYQCNKYGEENYQYVSEDDKLHICIENETQNPILDIKSLTIITTNGGLRFSPISDRLNDALTKKWPFSDRGKKWMISSKVQSRFYSSTFMTIKVEGSVLMTFRSSQSRHLEDDFHEVKTFVVPEVTLSPKIVEVSSGRSAYMPLVSLAYVAIGIIIMVFLG